MRFDVNALGPTYAFVLYYVSMRSGCTEEMTMGYPQSRVMASEYGAFSRAPTGSFVRIRTHTFEGRRSSAGLC
jgi:trehalose-6-phosphatase